MIKECFEDLNEYGAVQCPEHPNACTIPVYSINGVLYAYCECHDDIGLNEIAPSELN